MIAYDLYCLRGLLGQTGTSHIHYIYVHMYYSDRCLHLDLPLIADCRSVCLHVQPERFCLNAVCC